MAVMLQQSNSKGPGAVGGFQLKKVEVFSFTKISRFPNVWAIEIFR